ncbi:MAG: cytochrome c biogenesis protein CcdA [Anaerolineae bacterium]|nr:cytochrome c biogenesis protein CcdA [Anaerolineae bacterium]
MDVTIWVAALAGIVSFLSPCVFPLVPAYIGYLSGRVTQNIAFQTSKPDAQVSLRAIDRVNTLAHGVAFVAGFTLIFIIFGLTTTVFIRQIGGQNVALVRDIIGRVGGLLIIFFGLQFMGVMPALFKRAQSSGMTQHIWFSLIVFAVLIALAFWAMVDWLFALPVVVVVTLWFFLGGAFTKPDRFWSGTFDRLQRVLYADTRRQFSGTSRRGFLSSLTLGIVFAAGWTPCIGPIYGSILTMAATGGDIGQAGTLMLAYSLGLGIPFLIAALLLDSVQGIFRRMRRSIRYIELVSGVFMVFIGVLVATGRLQTLSQSFAVQFADLSYRMEECAVGLAQGDLTLGEFTACLGDAGQPDTAPVTQTPPENTSVDSAWRGGYNPVS